MKTIIKFNRIGRDHEPAELEFYHEDPAPEVGDLTLAIWEHCRPYLKSEDYGVEVSVKNGAVSVAIQGGQFGYGAGSIVDEHEVPC